MTKLPSNIIFQITETLECASNNTNEEKMLELTRQAIECKNRHL